MQSSQPAVQPKPKALEQQKTDFTAEGAPPPDGTVSSSQQEKPIPDHGATPSKSNLGSTRPKAKP